MEIPIHKDRNGQLYVEWEPRLRRVQADVDPTSDGSGKDWPGVGRYFNVVHVKEPHSGPASNWTDFPISSDLAGEQILVAFMTAVTTIIGGTLEFC